MTYTDEAGADWEDPLPLGWHTDLPAFPVDELPPVLAHYVDAISDEVQVPGGLTGPVVLGILAAAIGGRVRVWVRSGWEEPTNLYVVPVADPASRKSAVIAECRIPLDVAETALREHLAEQVADAQTQRDVLERFAEQAKKKAGRTGKPEDIAEAQDAVRAALAVEVRAHPRLTTADATPEAVVGLLAEQGGRIAAISAEAGLFDSLIGRYTARPNLDPILMAHAGDSILVDRRSRGPERVDRPALTLVASIQPYALREMVDRPDFAGRGLLARVLWSLPPNLAGSRAWEVNAAPEPVKRAYRALIADLATEVGINAAPVTLTLTEAAYKRLGEYYVQVEAMLHRDGDLAGGGLLQFWGGKLVGAAVRIAGCLHAAGGPQALNHRIEEGTVASAIALAEYFRAHAMAALTPANDERTRDCRTVLERLVGKGLMTFTVRELHRRLPRHLQKADRIVELVKYLTGLGFVRLHPTGVGYEVHPNAAEFLTPADTADSADTAAISAGQRIARAVSTPADTADKASRSVSGVSTPADSARKPVTRGNKGAVSTVSGVSRGTPQCRECGEPIDPAAGDTHPGCVAP